MTYHGTHTNNTYSLIRHDCKFFMSESLERDVPPVDVSLNSTAMNSALEESLIEDDLPAVRKNSIINTYM